jgi:magnesium transporter
VIKVRRYLDNGDVLTDLDPEEISDCLARPGELLWVDVDDPTRDEVTFLAKEFEVHRLAAEDLLETSPRPRLGRFEGHYLLVVRDPCPGDQPFNTREIDFLFGDGWLLTVRKPGDGGEPPATVDDIARRFERLRHSNGVTDEGFLLYVALDVILERCTEVLDRIEDRLEALEADIFTAWPGQPNRETRTITEVLHELRREYVAFRRAVGPLPEAIAPLVRGEIDFVGETAALHLRDVHDLAQRVTQEADTQRDLMNGALDAHLSLLSNRMNLVMKRATSWGAILVSTTVVTGIYGMNFRHMPELHWTVGYPLALAVMLAITITLYFTFKRRDWL